MEKILDITPEVLILQMGGFVLLLITLKLFLFKPVMAILDARRAEVENDYSSAEARRKEAEELRVQYEQHLAKIDEEMRAKITEAIKEGQTMREEIISDSRTQAERILEKAQVEIAREKDIAMAELKTEVATLAVEAAGKLINEKLDIEKHRELVSKYISGLDEVTR